MKAWKEALAQAIVDEWNSSSTVTLPGIGETDRAVKFSDVARAQGRNHVLRGDIIDIIHQVAKIAPHLHPVRVVADPKNIGPSEPLSQTLYFTDLEFEEE